jgi:hypothetical protein
MKEDLNLITHQKAECADLLIGMQALLSPRAIYVRLSTSARSYLEPVQIERRRGIWTWPRPSPTTILLLARMEAIFDNKANVLNAKLHASHDNSIIYAVSTSQTLWGRTYTYLRDTNPAIGGESTIVGAINWRKKTFEIQGQRKSIGDIRRKPKGFFKRYVITLRWLYGMLKPFVRTRFWRWADDRDEYKIVYHNQEEWQVNLQYSDAHVTLKANK